MRRSTPHGTGPMNRESLSICGYTPSHILEATDTEWNEVFSNETRKIFSVHDVDGQHIGEGQMVIEAPLYEAQLFILIGRKDLWYRGYGTAGLAQLLDLAFYTYGLHRGWVDIPEYNLPAMHMAERIGFVLEGRLQKHPPKRRHMVRLPGHGTPFPRVQPPARPPHGTGGGANGVAWVHPPPAFLAGTLGPVLAGTGYRSPPRRCFPVKFVRRVIR